ncbi:hypothetical protein [Rhodanobacter lindaniclasticus]
MELDANLTGELAGGRWHVNLNGSYINTFREKPLANEPYSSNKVGEYVQFYNLPLKWKHTLSVDWSKGDWTHTLSQIYRAGYKDEEPISVANDSYIPSRWNPDVDDYILYNYSLSWSGLRNTKFTFAVRNLLDTDPPFTAHQVVDFASGAAWEPRVADPRGRSFYLMVEYSSIDPGARQSPPGNRRRPPENSMSERHPAVPSLSRRQFLLATAGTALAVAVDVPAAPPVLGLPTRRTTGTYNAWIEIDLRFSGTTFGSSRPPWSATPGVCAILKADAYGVGIDLVMPDIIKARIPMSVSRNNEEARMVRACGYKGRLMRVRADAGRDPRRVASRCRGTGGQPHPGARPWRVRPAPRAHAARAHPHRTRRASAATGSRWTPPRRASGMPPR